MSCHFTHVTFANHGHSRKARILNTCKHIWIYSTVNLAWLKSSTTEPHQHEYFKSVFLIILNVPIRTVFAKTVTYVSYMHTICKLSLFDISMINIRSVISISRF